MSQPVIQHSFSSGEWAPALNARVDLQKYKSGAALLRNFFVDYRGGASTRFGTKFIQQAKGDGVLFPQIRLIPFQPAFNVSYILEFGHLYIRFYSQGSPIVENPIASTAITAATKANPCVLTIPGNTIAVGNSFAISGVVGMTQLNGLTVTATAVSGNLVTINVDSTAFTTYTSGGVVQASFTITGATQANPCVLTIPNNGYVVGDWIFVNQVAGMTQLNGKTFKVIAVTSSTVTIASTITGVGINSTGYTAYVSGGIASRIYTLPSPYAGNELLLIKFVQNVSQMILCHPAHTVQVLTLVLTNSWTILPFVFGSTIPTPSGFGAATSGAGSFLYTYQVTAVDVNGQETGPTSAAQISVGTVSPSNISLSWSAVTGAQTYNIYRSNVASGSFQAAGFLTGYVGSTTSLIYTESFNSGLPNSPANFSITPPLVATPSSGSPVASVTQNSGGGYTTVPSVSFASPPAGITASGTAQVRATSVSVHTNTPLAVVGDIVNCANGVSLQVTSVLGGGLGPQNITGIGFSTTPPLSSSVPANPVTVTSSSNGHENAATFDFGYGVAQTTVTNGGTGYLSAPAITYTPAGAVGTAVLGPPAAGSSVGPPAIVNPAVPAIYDQRLALMNLATNPGAFALSQPGSYTNFSYSLPAQDDDAIYGAIASRQVNDIKSAIPQPNGLLILTSSNAWLLNGGSTNPSITPINATAHAHAFNGASDVPPIVSDFDILYVQSKGYFVRDSSYNFYANVYTGTDISVLASHLFYGHQITEWAWAEEPFKLVWAIRDDGTVLSLTFLKAQEIVGWAHSDTNGQFKSVATVTELVQNGNVSVFVDAIYFVVQRTILGQTVQYVERLVDRFFPYGLEDSWCVDCALQTAPFLPSTTLAVSASSGNGVTFTAGAATFSSANIGSIIRVGGGIATITAFTSSTVVTGNITKTIAITVPGDPNNTPAMAASGTWGIWTNVSSVSNLDFLEGQSVSGVADGLPVGPLTVTNGTVTLPSPASKVTLGLQYTPQLQTLRLETENQGTIQGKRKKIPAVTVRCQDALGLSIGKSFSSVVPMKDLVLGNIGTMSNTSVTGLVTDDARTIIDPSWDVPGQYCIQQSNPWPATILGVIPEIQVGDN